ncbi:hypothetical protein PIB30_033926 [Stylosanthes scabra]|uniref:Uncharacterized protein n=1 Tax=Stylosanthes scabra TaxID=79078 RepID=A0ABU6XB36_9FABA|nr:hypothetical protein [Stylosanthes scabra]
MHASSVDSDSGSSRPLEFESALNTRNGNELERAEGAESAITCGVGEKNKAEKRKKLKRKNATKKRVHKEMPITRRRNEELVVANDEGDNKHQPDTEGENKQTDNDKNDIEDGEEVVEKAWWIGKIAGLV